MENGHFSYLNDNTKTVYNRKPDEHLKIYSNVLEMIGCTPMVKLNKIPAQYGVECDVYAKCEFLNPGGSVKDRIGYRMVEEAEANGILIPGKSVIVEPTSGNTGIGLALAACIKGYRCIIVIPEKMSDEKVNTLLSLGAEVIRTPTEAAHDSPDSNISVARRMIEENKDAVMLNQYSNPNNPLAHYHTTAQEILWATNDDVDMIVMGTGTGGTMTGIAYRVKQRAPKCQIVCVDPYGSIMAEPADVNITDVTQYEVEGIGYDFIPDVCDRSLVDKWIKVHDEESFKIVQEVIKLEGLLCGGSCGTALRGAMDAAKSLRKGQKCVVILPDGIKNYMTKFMTSQWLEARHWKDIPRHPEMKWWLEPLRVNHLHAIDNLNNKDNKLVQAVKLMKSKGSKMIAVNDKVRLLGVLTYDTIRRRIANGEGNIDDDLDKFINKKFYKLDLLADQPVLGHVSRILDIAPYVIVTRDKSIDGQVYMIDSETLLEHVLMFPK